MNARRCTGCGAALESEAQFCSRCGALDAGLASRRSAGKLTLILGAVAVLVVIAALFWGERRQATARTAEAAAADIAGAPPDISNMSPRERFDRLYNRSMRAAESGDASTLGTFAPMALLAYAQLDSVDADARYHAAMLKLHTGDVPGATVLADSILGADPGHLFGYVIQVTVARWQRDSAALTAAHRAFLAHYDTEMRAPRPEYAEHQTILADTRRDALAAAGN